MSSILCIEEEEEKYYNGVSRELKDSLSERGKCLVSLCLKGRGNFIVGKWLDNCKLFISISTKGFT
jgi:siroheme synthase (precorrin-2 oxidase/ferrochelatase)